MIEMNSQKGFHCFKLLAFWISLTIISLVRCTPPEEHIKCSSSSSNTNCTVTNTYGSFPDRAVCRASQAMYPKTEEELVSIVANATFLKRKMKVATTTSHSIPKLMCPDGENGLVISTKFLNRTVSLDESAMTITVEPGMTLRQLINVCAKSGLTLPYSPYWWGLTVGGILGTGSHGSTLWGVGSAVHDYVVQLRIVTPASSNEGYAKVRTLRNGTDLELDAARVSLGVLGVISQVTLQLEPMFKRSLTYVARNDSDLGEQVTTFGRQHEFADFQWYPSQRKVQYRLDDRVPTDTKGDGFYDAMGFRSTPSLVVALLRSTEETEESLRDAVGRCANGAITTSLLETSRFGLTNDGSIFNKYPVVGYNNRLQSSGTCLDSPQDGLITACPWDPRIKGLYYFQTAVSISLSKVKDFIQDVQKLVSLNPMALCGVDLYNGFLMRYVTSSSAYLGKEEDGLDFDITYYRSKDPMAPRLYEDFIEEIEQMAFFKYDGLPHWGKNRNLAFVGAINKYKKVNEFLKVKQLYDPLGLFSSEWSDQILGLKDGITTMKPGCALEGLCICSQDAHCAPQKGYFCRPGKVYKDARVCTRSQS